MKNAIFTLMAISILLLSFSQSNSKTKKSENMKRIMVVVTVHPEKVQDFETKRQAEVAKIGEWKEKGILENFFIKSAFDGSVLIFKDVTLEEAKQYNSTLPFHPFMENIQYYELEKQF